MLSADNPCKGYEPRSGPTKYGACSGWHSDGIPERFFWKVDFEKNKQTTKNHEEFPSMQLLVFLLHNLFTLCLLVLSAVNVCKQFGPRSGLTNHWTWSWSKLLPLWWYSWKNFMKICRGQKLSGLICIQTVRHVWFSWKKFLKALI